MGERTPKYKPEFEPPEKVELQKFPLQIAKIDTIAGKTGWAKYKISLPQSFRSLHYSDVLFGPDWRELIADFDKKPFGGKSQQVFVSGRVMTQQFSFPNILMLVFCQGLKPTLFQMCSLHPGHLRASRTPSATSRPGKSQPLLKS